LPLGHLLDAARAITGSDARFTWVDGEFLIAQGVAPFVELPLWVPAADEGFNNFAIDRALAAGLSFRPVEETIGDTLAWLATRPADHVWRAGLPAEREAELLRLWQAM
jgi:2'-hydroxyisoflavone reductase